MLIFRRQDDWNIYPIFAAMSTSLQRILDRKNAIAAPVDYKYILKMESTLARLSNAKSPAAPEGGGLRGLRGLRGLLTASSGRPLLNQFQL
jgi:hypothetical protein